MLIEWGEGEEGPGFIKNTHYFVAGLLRFPNLTLIVSQTLVVEGGGLMVFRKSNLAINQIVSKQGVDNKSVNIACFVDGFS